MPVTIDIRFSDDFGDWHEFVMVPGESLDTVDHVEYHIDCSLVPHIECRTLLRWAAGGCGISNG